MVRHSFDFRYKQLAISLVEVTIFGRLQFLRSPTGITRLLKIIILMLQFPL